MGDENVVRFTGNEKERVVEALEEKKLWSGGHGCYTPQELAKDLKIDFATIKEILNVLYREKKITVSPTVHGLGARIKGR